MFEYFYGYDNGSSACLAHYGIKGMRWGIRKVIDDYRKKRAKSKLIKNIDKNSNSNVGTWSSNYTDHSQGYFNAPNSGKNSSRYKLWSKMTSEYTKVMNGHDQNGGSKAEREWKKLNVKYRNAYLRAVLKDSNIPINKKNLRIAHEVIKSKDKEYSRYL